MLLSEINRINALINSRYLISRSTLILIPNKIYLVDCEHNLTYGLHKIKFIRGFMNDPQDSVTISKGCRCRCYVQILDSPTPDEIVEAFLYKIYEES